MIRYSSTRHDPDHRENHVEAVLRRRVRKELQGHLLKLAPTEKGTPDRLAILPGGTLEFIEVKRASGTVSKSQVYWADRVAEKDVPVTVIFGTTGVSAWIADKLERN